MPIKNGSNLHMPDARQAFLEEAGTLWDNQSQRIENLVTQAEKGVGKITFCLTIDVTESEPLLTVDIGFGQRYKDKRQRNLGNANQPALFDRNNQPASGIIDVSRNGHAEPSTGSPLTPFPEVEGKTVSFEQAVADNKKKGRKKAKGEEATATAAE